MKARIKWVEDALFVAESGSGHSFTIDGAAEVGGRNLGPRPMETVLLGLGGCSAIDVISILKKARQRVSDCVVDIEAERADAIPSVFTRIHLSYRISGTDLKEKQVQRAVDLSQEKYCSVTAMLRPGVEITHAVEIHSTQSD